jgi:DNA-binding response OmpR family regulator
MKSRILLAEDDVILGETLKDFFECNGLAVVWAQDGNAALQSFLSFKPELILLDVILPEKDGFEVIAEIRKSNTLVPIIIMTGTQFDISEQVKGYSLGAVNYLKKPITPQVVLAQVNSLINPVTIKKYEWEGLEITIDNQILTINKHQIILREKESHLLQLLLSNRDRIIPRNEILMFIWGSDDYYLNSSLDTLISRLKKCLHDFPNISIVSVYGNGYKLSV